MSNTSLESFSCCILFLKSDNDISDFNKVCASENDLLNPAIKLSTIERMLNISYFQARYKAPIDIPSDNILGMDNIIDCPNMLKDIPTPDINFPKNDTALAPCAIIKPMSLCMNPLSINTEPPTTKNTPDNVIKLAITFITIGCFCAKLDIAEATIFTPLTIFVNVGNNVPQNA